ncbi:MAG: acyloxyacyl hydrolase [Thermoanaerobaculia bacterium]
MRPRLGFAVGTAVLLEAASLAAQSAAGPKSDRDVRWSFSAGYGFSVKLNRGRSEEQVLLFAPAVAFPLGDRFEYVVEGHFATYLTPAGWMVGVSPLGGRYTFGNGRVRPYVSLGAGFGWTDLTELDEIDRRFNFLLQGSVGVRGRVREGAWSFEGRFAHMSNAGTVLPNLGLNSLVFLGGWTFR